MKTIDVNELAAILGGNNPICDQLQNDAALHIATTDEEDDDGWWWDIWSARWVVECAGGSIF